MSADSLPESQRFAPTLAYALRWRVAGVIPGAHSGRDQGQSGRFKQVVPFDRSPDPRRIDLRSMARDPFGGLHVRQFEQRASAGVEMLVDASASMAFGPGASHFSVAIELVMGLARAAYELHDAFGVAVCGESVDFVRPATRGSPTTLLADIGPMRPHGSGARGLLEAAERLVGRRRLVFVVSDFAFPLETFAALLDALTAHDVVPIQITENLQSLLPAWGLAELADLESGRRRLLFLSPSLRARWSRQAAQRREQVAGLAASRSRRPFVLEGAFNVIALADYLLGA